MKLTNDVNLKKIAALEGARLVCDGQLVGLGTGSTAAFVVEELGRRVREEGLKIECVATSYSTLELAIECGLRLLPLETVGKLDISIDGADEIDPGLNLIKGGGGAHTIEKLVHAMSGNFIVVADDSKVTSQLGARFPVPVEVLPSAAQYVRRRLRDLEATEIVLRSVPGKVGPILTDHGNFIFDARFIVADPAGLEAELNRIPGVVENGIFSNACNAISKAIIAGANGLDVREN